MRLLDFIPERDQGLRDRADRSRAVVVRPEAPRRARRSSDPIRNEPVGAPTSWP